MIYRQSNNRYVGIVLLALVVVLTVPTQAVDTKPARVFDVHLHFNQNQSGETTPEEAIRILKRQNVVYGVVSSTPPELALTLQAADPKRILPLWRPYLETGARHNWFNDKRVLPMARKELATGKYYGIGELHLISGLGATHKNTILNELIKLGIRHNVVILVHTETSSHRYFLPLCKRYPKARFLWAHAGSRLDHVEVGKLMALCRNVWVEFSARDNWRYLEDPIVDSHGKLLAGWRRLIDRYPDRFMIGVDPIWPIEYLHNWDEPDTGWKKYDDYLNFHRGWLQHLPRKTAERLRFTNAYKFFLGNRRDTTDRR